MLYSIARIYACQSKHENEIIECLAYSNGVSFERMRCAYNNMRKMLSKTTNEHKQK